MKRIKKYVKPKQEKIKPVKPANNVKRMPTRHDIGMEKLLAIHPNLDEVEGEVRSNSHMIFVFHKECLTNLFDKYLSGEINISYIRRWTLLIKYARKTIIVFKEPVAEALAELLVLADEDRMTRKKILEIKRSLHLRIERHVHFIDLENGKVVKEQYDTLVLPLKPKQKKKENKKSK